MATPDLLIDRPECGNVELRAQPFVSNRYHFGMLLGVADLETEQAYHRGKQWLHNAWLHGPGTIWGLAVEVAEDDSNELRVLPGLALDGHGRELSVTNTMCVDLVAWFEQRAPDDMPVAEDNDNRSFEIRVELVHESCLDRPVPSISEPCENATTDTAFSRAVERGLPRIEAGLHIEPDPPEDHALLRQFVGHAPVSDQAVTDALAAIASVAEADQPAETLRQFRRLAAADSMNLAPAEGAPNWSPQSGDGAIPLANVTVTLQVAGESFVVDHSATVVDNLIRPSHVRTRTTQELLFHRSF